MLIIILIIFAILALLIFTIYFLLRNVTNSINEKGKEYFALKLSELDEKNNELKEEKEEKEKKEKENQESKKENSKSNTIVVYQSKDMGDYDVRELLKVVKKIDSKFNYDHRYIVEEFVNQTINDDTTEQYQSLLAIKKYIDKIGVYKLLLKSDEDLLKFKDELYKLNSEFVSKYEKISEGFDVQNFVEYLNIEISINDPTIYVLVGNRGVSYNDISKKVKTVYKENIYKGIKIIYRNNVYDYSLG